LNALGKGLFITKPIAPAALYSVINNTACQNSGSSIAGVLINTVPGLMLIFVLCETNNVKWVTAGIETGDERG